MKRIIIKTRIGYIAFVLVVIFVSCSKDKRTLTKEIWLVENAKQHIDSAWMVNWNSPTISFIGKDKYVFQSDFYTHIGNVKIGRNNKISFDCTTHSYPVSRSFSYFCFILLDNINHYEIDGNKLILTGDNGATIVCY
jgi:hypothetical protein